MTNQINSAAFREVADRIEVSPSAYDQTTFGIRRDLDNIPYVELSCGTPCCVAGHLAALSDYAHTANPKPRIVIDEKLITNYDSEIDLECFGDSAVVMQIAMVSGGLSNDQREVLFGGMWPERWLDEDRKPLFMPPGGHVSPHSFRPDAGDAVFVLRRIAKFGFESEEFPKDADEDCPF